MNLTVSYIQVKANEDDNSFPCRLHVCLYANEDNNIIFFFLMSSTCLYVAFLLERRIIILAVHGQFPLITMHSLVNGWNPEVSVQCSSYSLIVLVRVVLKKSSCLLRALY